MLRFQVQTVWSRLLPYASIRQASRKSDVLSKDSDLCYTFLKPPSAAEMATSRAKEQQLHQKLTALIQKREAMSKKALKERKETVDALETMKDKYVILLRQRTMIHRSIRRRSEEMKKLKKVIATHRKALAA